MILMNKVSNIIKRKAICNKSIHFYSNKKTYSKDLPSEGLPVVGSLFSFIASGSSPKLHLYVDSKHKRLGPVFRDAMPGRNTVFLSDPDKIRQVFALEGKCPIHFLPESWLLYNNMFGRKRGLLFMEGEEWYHYRKILNQFLLKQEVPDGLLNVYISIVNSLISGWKHYSGSYVHNLEQDMYKHSISFMLATAMGSAFGSHGKIFMKDLETVANSYQRIFDISSKLMVLPVRFLLKLNLPIWKKFVKAMDESLTLSERIISKIKLYKSNDGLLWKLLDAGVSERMASVLLTDLMIAAGDTTAHTLQWALYLLGRDQDVQERIIKNSDIVRGVIKETLRLYPAAPFLTRILQQPLQVQGFHIPAGELIVMSMYTASRLDSNFPRAMKFLPDRWLRKGDGRMMDGVSNKFASLPFAMGARSCVGKKLAETLMSMTIEEILKHWSLTTMNTVEVVLRLIPVPSEKILLKIRCRQ